MFKATSFGGDGPYAEVTDYPESIDWREKGAVNPVGDQNLYKCGSCWAFASTSAIEAAHFIKTGELLKLSEQQFVDCDVGGVDKGCQGGGPMYAF